MDGNTMTLATQMAVRFVKEQIRAEGRKLRDYAASDLRKAAASYLSDHPEIIEAAVNRIATDPRFERVEEFVCRNPERNGGTDDNRIRKSEYRWTDIG